MRKQFNYTDELEKAEEAGEKSYVVVGYDDITLAAYSSPQLTTVRQNIRHAGQILVESVLALIRGEDVPDTTLASELVVRKSSIAA